MHKNYNQDKTTCPQRLRLKRPNSIYQNVKVYINDRSILIKSGLKRPHSKEPSAQKSFAAQPLFEIL